MLALNEPEMRSLQVLAQDLRTVFTRVAFCNLTVGLEKTHSLAFSLISSILVPADYLLLLHEIPAVRVPLSWLVEQSRDRVLHDTPATALFQNWLEIPEEYKPFRVWCYLKDLYLTPLKLLAWWVTVCKNQLISSDWTADSEHITFIVRLSGEFKVQRLEIEGVGHDFWVLEVESNPACLPQESLAAALLIVQLAAQQGNGVLTLHRLSEQQFEIHFSISRAETSAVLPHGWLVERDETRRRVTDHITRLIVLSYKKACQQLKLTLSQEELPRLESLLAQGEVNKDLDLCIRGLHRAINELDEILQTLDSWQRSRKPELTQYGMAE